MTQGGKDPRVRVKMLKNVKGADKVFRKQALAPLNPWTLFSN